MYRAPPFVAPAGTARTLSPSHPPVYDANITAAVTQPAGGVASAVPEGAAAVAPGSVQESAQVAAGHVEVG